MSQNESDRLAALLAALEEQWLKGNRPPIDLKDFPEAQLRLERLLSDIRVTQEVALALAQGDLSRPLHAKGFTAGSLKSLQANLRHLTWQTQMIAQGDLTQHVDFMGEFADSFNSMVRNLEEARSQLRQHAAELAEMNARLQAQLFEIQALQAQLREQAIRDPLTNLFNRRYLQETLEREFASAARSRDPVAIILLDVDHFKQLNDTYGHKAGDLMLQALAGILSARTRSGDVACRYGGEEFVVVMPGASLESAYQRAEELRTTCAAERVPWGETVLQATISLGVAAFPTSGQTVDQLLRAADQCLYAAKAAGRNCVMARAAES